MKKWEYLFIRVDYFAGDLRPSSVNGEEFRDKQAVPPLYTFVNKLGEDGWEAVGMNYTPSHGYGFLILKRPQESSIIDDVKNHPD
ncbi:MAG TPA: hypothetical protein V6D12_16395 [Candidatus Obscuribacterales bacterium]